MTETLHERSHPTSPAPNLRLSGRRIVITGAASGIGRSTVKLFAQEGAAVALLDRNAAALNETVESVKGHGIQADITDEASVTAAINSAAAALGGIDGVVNAAGIMFRGTMSEVPADAWRHVLEVNLTGTYIVTRACLPWLLREPSATIVNIASAQGLLPNAPSYTAYAASKGGVINLSKALAAELAPRVRVNTICPGMTDTAMADGYRSNVTDYALARLADPAEIARAILFLTGTESSFVTGTALAADGGRTFH